MENNFFQDEDTQKGKYLTFALGNESFGLEIGYVREIVGIQQVTALPDMPDYFKGVVNLRGSIIPVIDMRLRFCMKPGQYTERTCIIVVDVNGFLSGLIVDSVSEVLKIENDDVVSPPDCRTGVNNRYIKSIGKVGQDVKLLLDCENLFGEEVLNDLSNY